MTDYDFSSIIDRRNTNSIKFDFIEERNMPEDVMPMWVADMDFETAPSVLEAIAKRAEHGVYGYTKPKEDYNEVLVQWMKKHHDWVTEPEWYFYTPGVVFAISMALRALTKEGDAVMIQRPVYYPFSSVVTENDRILINNPLIYHKEGENKGKYMMDPEAFEAQIVKHGVKVFILCNPHNPVGRVWSKKELEKIGDLCVRHGVFVISDEIHEDFIYHGYQHIPFAGIKEEYKNITVTCTSPSKTFNLAGLQLSNIIVANKEIRDAMRREITKTGYDEPNIFGLVASQAAYTGGEEWLNGLNQYLTDNLNYVRNFLKEYLPGVTLIEPEGTYLIWLDFSKLGYHQEELDRKIIEEGRLWLDSGSIFGEEGNGFQRINIAVPRKILEYALQSLNKTFSQKD